MRLEEFKDCQIKFNGPSLGEFYRAWDAATPESILDWYDGPMVFVVPDKETVPGKVVLHESIAFSIDRGLYLLTEYREDIPGLVDNLTPVRDFLVAGKALLIDVLTLDSILVDVRVLFERFPHMAPMPSVTLYP